MVKEPGFLLDKDPQDLVQLAYSQSILEAAIGMATINSLLETDEDSCIELNAAELIKEKGKDKKVAIVGHFPFILRFARLQERSGLLRKTQGGRS